MSREENHGFAQIQPTPTAWFCKWRVWYFNPGEKETHKYTNHMRRKTAERRAEWWAKQPHVSGITNE